MQHFCDFFVNIEINLPDLWSFYETGIFIKRVGLNRILLNYGIDEKGWNAYKTRLLKQNSHSILRLDCNKTTTLI